MILLALHQCQSSNQKNIISEGVKIEFSETFIANVNSRKEKWRPSVDETTWTVGLGRVRLDEVLRFPVFHRAAMAEQWMRSGYEVPDSTI